MVLDILGFLNRRIKIIWFHVGACPLLTLARDHNKLN